jgi:hypothetical protein
MFFADAELDEGGAVPLGGKRPCMRGQTGGYWWSLIGVLVAASRPNWRSNFWMRCSFLLCGKNRECVFPIFLWLRLL